MNTLDLRSVCWPFFSVVEIISKATLENFIAKLDGQQARPIPQREISHGRCWNRKQDRSGTNFLKRPRNYPGNLPENETKMKQSSSLSRQKLKAGALRRPELSSQTILKDCPRSTVTRNKTRAWVAWNQLQCTKLTKPKEANGFTGISVDPSYNEKLRTTGTVKDIRSNAVSSRQWLELERCRNPSRDCIGHRKVNNARKVLESSISKEEAHLSGSTQSSIPLQALNDRVSRNASNPKSQREAAIRAIDQVLTPSLCPSREGRGDLELQLAGYLTALNSSALTNEANHREKDFHTRLASVMQCVNRSNSELKSMDSWLDIAEARLCNTPTSADVLYLQGLLERSSTDGTYPICVKERIEDTFLRQRISSRSIGSHKEMLQYIKQEVLQMEASLAGIPNVYDIQRMRPKLLRMEMEMNRHEETTREAVRKLRHAVGRGEVAWFRNLDVSTSRLESLARVLVPLEATYKGDPAPARV